MPPGWVEIPAEVTTLTQHIIVSPRMPLSLVIGIGSTPTTVVGRARERFTWTATLLKTYDLCQVTSGWTNEQLAIPAEFRGKTSDLIFKAETAPDPSEIFISSFLLDDVSILGALSSVSLKSPGQDP